MDQQRLLATMRVEAQEGEGGDWLGTTTYARDQLLLTADEARALGQQVEKLTARYTWEKRQGRVPKDATTFNFSVILARDVDNA